MSDTITHYVTETNARVFRELHFEEPELVAFYQRRGSNRIPVITVALLWSREMEFAYKGLAVLSPSDRFDGVAGRKKALCQAMHARKRHLIGKTIDRFYLNAEPYIFAYDAAFATFPEIEQQYFKTCIPKAFAGPSLTPMEQAIVRRIRAGLPE